VQQIVVIQLALLPPALNPESQFTAQPWKDWHFHWKKKALQKLVVQQLVANRRSKKFNDANGRTMSRKYSRMSRIHYNQAPKKEEPWE